jgi:hypothetical protein
MTNWPSFAPADEIGVTRERLIESQAPFGSYFLGDCLNESVAALYFSRVADE